MIQDREFQNNSVKILEKDGEPETILKKKYLKQLYKNLNRYITTYKGILKEANNDDYLQKKAKYKDAVYIYITDILPLQNKIRDVKYDESFVESNELDVNLFEPILYTVKNREHSINNNEIIADEYAIISNEK